MATLYLDASSLLENGYVSTSCNSTICLFVLNFCKDFQAETVLVLQDKQNKPLSKTFQLNIANLKARVVPSSDGLPYLAQACHLPVLVTSGQKSCVAGLCSVLRFLIRHCLRDEEQAEQLLGFRQGCLMACAEVSVWTRFCEIDMVHCVETLLKQELAVLPENQFLIPIDLMRFEVHMGEPLRIHNIDKIREREHLFAEGPEMTLADLILLPCIHTCLLRLRHVYLRASLPLTYAWYDRMLALVGVPSCLEIIQNIPSSLSERLYIHFLTPPVNKHGLYKRDPTRYKPKFRLFTRQDDVDASLEAVAQLNLESFEPEEDPVSLDWEALPLLARPEGGDLPPSRLERKRQQLENVAGAVLRLAKLGDVIVDFCSGSGHLGIILAYLLPRSQIILLENKEASLNRAKKRSRALGLTNVLFAQCNLDYFSGGFDIGVCLHACGVATDLVIAKCLSQRAAFVACPCCYGSVQPCHLLSYPRSQAMARELTLRQYLVLGHAADQTHGEGHALSDQGNACMAAIDTDRATYASEHGYTVTLGKLRPASCTPKNNLLIGLPQ